MVKKEIINNKKIFKKCDGCCGFGCEMKHTQVKQCIQCKGRYDTCCWKNGEFGLSNREKCGGCVVNNIDNFLDLLDSDYNGSGGIKHYRKLIKKDKGGLLNHNIKKGYFTKNNLNTYLKNE